MVRAAGRRQIPAADTAATATATDQVDPDHAWRAGAAAIAGRTCRYVAALQASPGTWPDGRVPSVEQLAPFCGSCSSEAPTVEIPVVRPEQETAVVIHRGAVAPLAVRSLSPAAGGSVGPTGPRWRARGAVWWTLALSASALIGGTAALLHGNPADGSPRPKATAADVPPPAAPQSPPPAVGRAEGAGETTSATPSGSPPSENGLPASSRPPVPAVPRPSSTAQLPALSGTPTAGAGSAAGPTAKGPAEAPAAVRTSPAPNPTGPRRPSADSQTVRPTAPGPGASTEPPVIVRPTAPAPGASTEPPVIVRPTAPAPGASTEPPVIVRPSPSPSHPATPSTPGSSSDDPGSTAG
ncbi:hypothetical protein ACFWOG_28960 [Kitasatospora sp. NPDC058406]|uniref:hypothetical protein n=1 Tax=Kitasatospora sp. NPDC058406 TaxID=3346483 RepID=UPI00365C9DB0